MSSRREKYDGTLSGGNPRNTERRGPVNSETEIDKSATSKRTTKNNRKLDFEEKLFEESSETDRYLITYSDLITLLLGLFIILYAISNIDLVKYQNMSKAMGNFFGESSSKMPVANQSLPKNQLGFVKKVDPMVGLRMDLERLINTENLGNSIKLEENERGFTIHILDNILFATGSDELFPESKAILHQLANIIRILPNDIRVEGHTDNVPIRNNKFQSNWHLSVARALQTAYYLIEVEKMDQSKISIVGYSEFKPIASNDTPEGRATNRRVDITILKK